MTCAHADEITALVVALPTEPEAIRAALPRAEEVESVRGIIERRKQCNGVRRAAGQNAARRRQRRTR